MKLAYKKIVVVLALLLLSVLALYIGPMNGLRHGHYYEEYDFSQIPNEDMYDYVVLESDDYEIEFSPVKEYLNGVSILLFNQPEDNEGTLILSLIDENERIIEEICVDLSKPQEGVWYKTYINKSLKKDRIYKLRFSTGDCKVSPYLQKVDKEYLPKETISGNVLIAYSYAQATFSLQERILLTLAILSLNILLIAVLVKNKKRILYLSAVLSLTVLLSWNYTHNSMDSANTRFSGFQIDSETLATNVIFAEQDQEYFRSEEEFGYGLGRYCDLKGDVKNYNRLYRTDDNWNEGYSRTKTELIINSNDYSKEVAAIGNSIEFLNGEEYLITDIQDDNSNIIVSLNSQRLLTPLRLGSLDDAVFYDSNHNRLHKGLLVAYKSQYGLHGKIFRHLARYMQEDEIINNMYLICCLFTAIVFALISFIVGFVYNKVMAGCFFITFWLSPWIVNFARNIYWVEFTWFIPMLVGLFCLWKIEERKCRVISYLAAFVAVCFKSLCGYEYISVVMMGLIAFLAVEAITSLFEKKKERFRLVVRTIIILGLLAIAGFIVALFIHAKLKGNGDIWFGIKEIFEKDVLRRTKGADLNEYSSVLWASFNSSVWETYSKYFKFETEVITGITGNLFPILCIIPLGIFLIDYKKKNINVSLPIMYIVFFLTSISWFCLAKGHSYNHTHINYVLWYFGFVQICFYIIINKLIQVIKR